MDREYRHNDEDALRRFLSGLPKVGAKTRVSGIELIGEVIRDVVDEGQPAVGSSIGLERGLIDGADSAGSDTLVVRIGLVGNSLAVERLVEAMAK